MKFSAIELKKFAAFVRERHNVYLKKKAGEPWPWTKDPVLQTYRFCNVYRDLDKESELIQKNWLHAKPAHPDSWFAMVVARLVNWWPSLAEVGYPLPWDPHNFTQVMDERREEGEKVFTGAYMIHADAHHGGSKAAYLAEGVLTPMWNRREELRPRKGDTLDSFHKRLMTCRDMGSFMAGQVVGDAKHAPGSPLKRAEDFWSWATSGPGSMKGLNIVLGRDPKSAWTEATWREAFQEFQVAVAPYLDGMPPISGQDLQNCLCEYCKFVRGYSRSKYHPPKGA